MPGQIRLARVKTLISFNTIYLAPTISMLGAGGSEMKRHVDKKRPL